MLKKLNIDNKEINFFIISADTGKIKSSGDIEMPECWEDTFVDLETLEIGKQPSLCFNKAHKSRYLDREPKWTDLNYKVTSIEEIKDEKSI